MNNQEKAERVVALVNEMRENSHEMRMWRNIPLAQECVQLLQEIDDPEETPLGKAMAVNAIIEQLPEYDTPRYVLSVLQYEKELLLQSDENDEYVNLANVAEQIQRLEAYIDLEHVSDADFDARYHRHLRHDPVERTEAWEANYYAAEEACDKRLEGTPRGMGFCFAYWPTLQAEMQKRGIAWRTLQQMNPRVRFD